MNEAEIRAELIDPALREAGWGVVAESGTRREGASLDHHHLAEFKSHLPAGAVEELRSVLSPRQWAACTGLGNALPELPQSRSDLLKLAQDASVPIAVVCWSILAWGGMHGRHRDALNERGGKQWLSTAEKVRCGGYSRESGYDAFCRLQADGLLPGMGPAFFTKLIFFLMPRSEGSHPGYIMDQWAGCSINLLAGRQVVLMDYSRRWMRSKNGAVRQTTFTVSNVNRADNYEDFCLRIEDVARGIERGPADTELLLMSEGGHGRKPWRKYVIENRCTDT